MLFTSISWTVDVCCTRHAAHHARTAMMLRSVADYSDVQFIMQAQELQRVYPVLVEARHRVGRLLDHEQVHQRSAPASRAAVEFCRRIEDAIEQEVLGAE